MQQQEAAGQPHAPPGTGLPIHRRMPPSPSPVPAQVECPSGNVGMDVLMSDIVGPGGDRARRSLDHWMARRGRGPAFEDVHGFVTGHAHGVLHGLTVADVEAATMWQVRRGESNPMHALGDLNKRADGIEAVDNWPAPPWAFNYVFHDLMERLGRVPTWPDVEAHLRGAARERILAPFAADFGFPKMAPEDRVRHCRALRWRLATAYYSFVREVDLIVRLRAIHGLPVRYHVLADAQFKVDLWCGRVLVSLLIRNPKYRDSGFGRKRRAGDMLDGAAFEALSVELAVPDAFGRPSLVPAAEISLMAGSLRTALARAGAAGAA